MPSFDFKKFLPHILIVVGFALLAVFFSYPILSGKVLKQGDVLSWKAMSHEALDWKEKTGEMPLWTNSMFGGMPAYTMIGTGDSNKIGYITKAVTAILVKPAYFFFIAMLGFYVLMCTLRVNRWLGVIGAIAFAFSSFNAVSIVAGHDTKILAMTLMPWVLSGMLLLYRGRYLAGGALFGVSLTLMGATNHYQILFYEAAILGIAGVGLFINAIRKQQLKTFFIATAVAVLTGLLAVGTIAGNLIPTREYLKETMRGGESELTLNKDKDKKPGAGGLNKSYAFQWSNGVGETFCLMIPYLYGGSSGEPIEMAPSFNEAVGGNYEMAPMYWGDQPFLGGPIYFGAIICFLFVLGMLVIRSPHKWWMLVLCVLSIFMSLGRNFDAFNDFLFYHLPLYNAFRTPTMALSIAEFFFPVIGIWGLSEILTGKIDKEEAFKKLKIAAGITAGLCILIGVGGSMFFDFTNSAKEAQYPAEILRALKDDRMALARNSGLKSALLILIAAGLVWMYLKGVIKNMTVVAACIGLLVTIDLVSVSAHYLDSSHYEEAADEAADFPIRAVDQQILQDKDPYYRVLDITTDVYGDAKPAYYHKLIGGYSPAKMERYQDLIDIHMSKNFNASVLNMLNTKYIIFQGGPNGQPAVQRNDQACGNAWFVSEVKPAKTADEEILALKGPNIGDTVQMANAFEPKKTAVMRDTFAAMLNGYAFGKDSNATVKLTKYGLNKLDFESHNTQNGVAVFSDIYYKYGWHAFVDDKETPIMKADYLLRAIKIPAGDHKIEFRFTPESVAKYTKVSVASSIVMWLLILGGIVVAVRRKKEEKDGTQQEIV